nr:hypothetical protein [Micromonospora sediminicola]
MGAAGLFVAAAAVGAVLGLAGRPVRASAAPLFGHPLPHLGPGTPLALATAALVIWHGPRLAARLGRVPLFGLAYLAALAWTFSLALIDGAQRGLTDRLTTRPEYLTEVPGVRDVPAMVRGFAGRILDFQPDSWTTHVAGHPPGALLVFVGLDRIGLAGGGWAAVLCVLVGATVAVTVPVTVLLLGGDRAARAAVPFVVLFPGAVWIGASADGLFAGVTSAGVALLAFSARRRGVVSAAAALGAGVVLGAAVFLSYGLVLTAPIALAVLVVTRRFTPLPYALVGAAAVVAGFAAAGFWWWDGYHLVVERYYQGIASDRPYAYWVWANLACVVASAGPAAAPMARRALARVSRAARAAAGAPWAARPSVPRARITPRPTVAGTSWLLLPTAALAAILLADLSGLSKAEVERIWLPFTVWLVAGAAVLPGRHRRGWLIVQATTALAVNHLVLTVW